MKLSTKVLMALLLLFTSSVMAQNSKIDAAAQRAAIQISEQLKLAKPNIKRIAFVPMRNDQYAISDVIGAGLSSQKTGMTFIFRPKGDWEKAINDETDRMGLKMGDGDLYDPKTIITVTEKHMNIQGPEAFLFVKGRYLNEKPNGVELGLTVTLFDIKTETVLTSLNVSVNTTPRTAVQYMFDDAIQDAAEDAAYNLSKELANKNFEVDRIAILPFGNDEYNISDVIHNELTRTPGMYEFFTKSRNDWGRLVGDTDFTQTLNTNSDIMASISKVSGAQVAILGNVVQAQNADGKGQVRISIKLINIATTQQLWGANIKGEFNPPEAAISVSSLEVKVAQALGDKVGELFKNKIFNNAVKVYVTPFTGAKSHLDQMVVPKIISANNSQLTFYNLANDNQGRGINQRLAVDLNAGSFGTSEIARLAQQLDNLDMALDGINSGVRYKEKSQAPKAAIAILYGRVISFTDEPEIKDSLDKVTEAKGATFAVSFELRDLRTQQVYWADTVSATVRKAGVAQASHEDVIIHEAMSNKGMILKVLGGLLGVVFIMFILKSMTRSR